MSTVVIPIEIVDGCDPDPMGGWSPLSYIQDSQHHIVTRSSRLRIYFEFAQPTISLDWSSFLIFILPGQNCTPVRRLKSIYFSNDSPLEIFINSPIYVRGYVRAARRIPNLYCRYMIKSRMKFHRMKIYPWIQQ